MAGYDFQVIDQYPQQLHCGICTLIIHNAMNGCSKHVFCKTCIEKYVENEMKNNGNMKCPGGCAIAINPNKLEPNEFVDRLVNTLACKCSNDACNWKGDLLDLIQEQHVIECLDEQVNCSYDDIGCMKKVCRKDMVSHEEAYQREHTKLIYQNLVTCKKELVASQSEIAILKQENATLKQENATLKQENAAIKEDNVVMKKESKLLMNTFDEQEIRLKTTSKGGQEFGKGSFDTARYLSCGNVSLINNNQVLVVKCNKTVDELSKCYETNNFDCVTDHFHCSHNKNKIADLFAKTLYHWYECGEYCKFIFPIDMNNITNFEITILDKFNFKLFNKNITVDNMRMQECQCFLYVQKNKKKLFHQKKFHLHNLNSCGKCSTSFAHGYACIEFLPKSKISPVKF